MLPLFLVIVGVLSACDSPEPGSPLWSIQGQTMGTTYQVKIVDPPETADRTVIEAALEARLEKVNRQMSTYRADSDLSRFNQSRSTEWTAVPIPLRTVVDAALEVSELSGGAFDVTVGPLVNLWGFGPGKQEERVPAATEIEQALQRVGARHLLTRSTPPALRKKRPDLYVDLSAIAKGYAVDVLSLYLEESGISRYLVEIGGEVRSGGTNPNGEVWRIAVERPTPGQRAVLRTVALSERGMATSGDYRNYFVQDGRSYSHTIDPHTGSPVRNPPASVTVVADSAMFADAMATALTVLGPEAGFALAEQEGIAALFIRREGDTFTELATPLFREFMTE